MDASEIITIVLSLVALIVTVVGFFASLQFYRDAVELQTRSANALAKIEEKASSIQSQLGGMFSKTLDAAIGRGGTREAERQQRELQESSVPEPGERFGTAAPIPAGGSSSFAEDAAVEGSLASLVLRYFMFRQMRLTDVSAEPARSVFLLGSSGAFNLFDGIPGIVFLGYFHSLPAEEVVARVRMLFTNLDLSYKRVNESLSPPQKDEALRILNQIRVEILIPNDIDPRRLRAKINEFQPSSRTVEVNLLTCDTLKQLVDAEYEKMRL